MKRNLLFILPILLLTACIPTIPSSPDVNGTATQDALNRAATQTAAAFVPTPTATQTVEPLPSDTATPTVFQPTPSDTQFLAYISNGQLLVTDVTNNMRGGTTQYTVAGQSDQVTDLVWSPSGEFVAFVSVASGEPRIFYIYALGQSSPTDLGPGSAPAWSPDSQSIAYVSGTFPNDNIWVTTIDIPEPRQLTFELNYAWGRPVFTPDGNSLVVAGVNRDNMGAQGNTTFTLQSLALDGSGARATLPGATPMDGVRLPQDMRFSPNGLHLAFSTSYHWNACASPGAYYVSDAVGGNRQELISPSLKLFVDPDTEHFHVGLSYTWSPHSEGLVALGNVIDCNLNSPTMGQVIAGPQIAILRMDGTEGYVIPGFFYGISMDRTGNLIAAARFPEGFQDLNPNVEIYSFQTGQLVLSMGPGSNPQFQP